MDEELNITSMSRLAGYEESFDHLSMDTQEQIMIFTCREQLFEGLGAHQSQLAPGDPESLLSA